MFFKKKFFSKKKIFFFFVFSLFDNSIIFMSKLRLRSEKFSFHSLLITRCTGMILLYYF